MASRRTRGDDPFQIYALNLQVGYNVDSEIIEIASIVTIILSLTAAGGSFAWLVRMIEPNEMNLTSFCRVLLCAASLGIFMLLLGAVFILGGYADLLAQK